MPGEQVTKRVHELVAGRHARHRRQPAEQAQALGRAEQTHVRERIIGAKSHSALQDGDVRRSERLCDFRGRKMLKSDPHVNHVVRAVAVQREKW